jgi:hypothetical protein
MNVLCETEFQSDVDHIASIKRRSRLAACMSILRNSLAEGNQEFKEALANSYYDKSKSYEKLVLMILNNCEKNIKDNEIEQILNPDNILKFNSNFQNLIKFNTNALSQNSDIEITVDELSVLKEINDASQTLDTDLSTQEDEIGIGGLRISQFGNWQYVFVGLAIALTFVIVFGGLWILLRKKPGKEKKKEKSKKN